MKNRSSQTISRFLIASCILLQGAFAPLEVQAAMAPPIIQSPRERAIFQRDDKNAGQIPVICTAPLAAGTTIEVRAINKKTGNPANEWTTLASVGNTCKGQLTLQAGWYKLEFRSQNASIGTVEHVGVGEVLITCGQSNSANHGKPPQKAQDERVSTCHFGNGFWRHGDDPQPGASGKGGSPWALLGDLLVKKYDVPVGFICVGVGGTPVSFWTPRGKGYAQLKRALQIVGPHGCRAVLWHQGESDSIAGTTAENYAKMLGSTIAQSRKDAGWDVPWGVALASFHPSPKATPERQTAIIEGQKKVIATVPGVFQGAETDSYHTRGWLADTVHFNDKGLAAHAQGWADALANRIPPNRPSDAAGKAIPTASNTNQPSVETSKTNPVTIENGVIHCFPNGEKDCVIAHYQIDGKKLWVDAIRRDGKTRQVRITSYVGQQGTKTPVKLFWPEIADGTITWNMPVQRQGDIVSLMLPWNGVLIGDLMDVNEGLTATDKLRKQLGIASGADRRLPILYSSGDSISLGYWPYLEAELNNEVNVYYQQELAKDIPQVNLRNNGHASLAYGVLETAFKNERFKPEYCLMNCGLHMIATHQNKVAEYGEWIEKLDDLIKKHNAKLIWVLTTPYAQSFRPQQNLVIIKFNETAKAIATKRGIPVVDLHACTLDAVKDLGEKNVYEDGVHFKDEVKKRQAAFIAARVREIIKENKPITIPPKQQL